jgi:acyl-coenzyme A thioesterase PaaI-like protein
MDQEALQDHYPDEVSRCYGCGRLNEHGLQLKSYWDGEETVALFQPQAYHCGISGFVYGGLIASLIDCHAVGTAAAAAYRAEGRAMDTEPPFRFVTGSLQVRYIRPTPLGPPLTVRGHIEEIKGRKVVVSVSLSAEGHICAEGQVVAVQMPEHMTPRKDSGPSGSA